MAHCALLVSIDLPPRIELKLYLEVEIIMYIMVRSFNGIFYLIYNFKIQKHKVWFEKQQLTPVINLAKNQIILDELQI